eukprot:4128870-Pyramimonas_sp.AAC.1
MEYTHRTPIGFTMLLLSLSFLGFSVVLGSDVFLSSGGSSCSMFLRFGRVFLGLIGLHCSPPDVPRCRLVSV